MRWYEPPAEVRDETAPRASVEAGTLKRPNRAIAVVLSLLTPLGVAHYYAGLPRRALLWFGSLYLALVLVALLFGSRGHWVGFWLPAGVAITLGLVTYLGPAIDLLFAPVQQLVRPALWRVLAVYGAAVLASIVLQGVVRAVLVEAFKIPSGAMLPTLGIGDHIFVDKLRYGPAIPFVSYRLLELPPARGDLVVFEYPYSDLGTEPMDFVKRVVAIEGDTLEVDGGQVILNGWRVPRCRVGTYAMPNGLSAEPQPGELYLEFLGDRSYLTWFDDASMTGKEGPYQVESGEFWVLGDNRNNSSDSRAWNGRRGAGVPHAKLKGRSSFVWLAFAPDGSVDWDRIGTDLLAAPRLPSGAPRDLLQALERCLSAPPRDTLPPAQIR